MPAVTGCTRAGGLVVNMRAVINTNTACFILMSNFGLSEGHRRAGFLFEPPQYISYFSLSRSAVLTISHLWRVSFCYLKTCLAQNHFQLCSSVKWAIHGGETPPNTVCLNALAVLKQRREADAALFSELHRKLQTQVGIWISLWEVLSPTEVLKL